MQLSVTQSRSVVYKTPDRVAIANNCNLPVTSGTGTNWVLNCWTTHRSGPYGYYGIEATFVNGLLGTNAENNGFYDFDLRSGLCISGNFYQGLCNGQSEVTVPKEWGRATFYYPVYIPPNTNFYITNRRVATDLGAAGSYRVIRNTSGITARQDGLIAGTNTSIDYTLGVGVAYGAKCLQPPTISGTGLTAVTIDPASRGTGYSSAGQLAIWYGAAGGGNPGATASGAGVTGTFTVTGGHANVVNITNTGSNHSASFPPTAYVGGVGTANTGFGSPTDAYGPSLITGIPRTPAPSVLLQGDSNTAGYGVLDTAGDIYSNHGFYEQGLSNNYGLHKLAINGESASGWVGTHTQQLAFVDNAIQRGLRPSHVVLALGGGDFVGSTATTVLNNTVSSFMYIAAIWRARGAKVISATILPANSSTGSFTTVSEQTPTNSNFSIGGNVDAFNSGVRNNTTIKSDGIVDGRAIAQSTISASAWTTTAYTSGTAFCETDGRHPSVACGIPFGVLNLSFPPMLR